MPEIRSELDLYMATDNTQSWLGFLDDEIKLGRRKEEEEERLLTQQAAMTDELRRGGAW